MACIYSIKNRIRKYIAFHDTETYGLVNENNYYSNPAGLNPAIKEFLQNNPEWIMDKHYKNNNGLTIIKRVNTSK
jgi:hypothetical protein